MGPSVDTSHLYVPSARAVTFLNRTRPPNVPLLHSSFKITRQENNNQKSRRKETEMKGKSDRGAKQQRKEENVSEIRKCIDSKEIDARSRAWSSHFGILGKFFWNSWHLPQYCDRFPVTLVGSTSLENPSRQLFQSGCRWRRFDGFPTLRRELPRTCRQSTRKSTKANNSNNRKRSAQPAKLALINGSH